MRAVTALALSLIAVFAFGGAAPAHTRPPAYRLAVVLGGLDQPVGATAAPGETGKLYVVERLGKIVIVQGGAVTGTFIDLGSVIQAAGGEQGLLSVAFSPGYATNHRFYVGYTDVNGDTAVAEYRSSGGVDDPNTARLLLVIPHPYTNHNGGQLQFDKKGLLYLGSGDGGSGGDPNNNGQNLSSQLGKLLRTDPTQASPTWQIVGYGLRNPWRYSFDRSTGDLWIGDVGQNLYEEIDFRAARAVGSLANYGWSVYEGNVLYKQSQPLNRAGTLVTPIYVYDHSHGDCAVIGGYVYRGPTTSATGRYFFGDFCSGRIWSIDTAARAKTVRLEPFTAPQLSGFGEDGAGNLFAVTLDGTLYEITA